MLLKCGHAIEKSRVIDSRKEDNYVRRRRKCRVCGVRDNTIEICLPDPGKPLCPEVIAKVMATTPAGLNQAIDGLMNKLEGFKSYLNPPSESE